MTKKKEIPGNAIASQLELDRELISYALVCWRVSREQEAEEGDGVMIRQVKIKSPHETGENWLCIVTAWVGGEAKVAFHSEGTLREALRGVMNRLHNKSLRWKEDEYEQDST